MSIVVGNGWNNPYTSVYESIVAELDAKVSGLITEVNNLLSATNKNELSHARHYIKLAAPTTWSSQIVDPLNLLSDKINSRFGETLISRIAEINQANITSVYSFKA